MTSGSTMSPESSEKRCSIWLTRDSITASVRLLAVHAIAGFRAQCAGTMETAPGHLRVQGRLDEGQATFTLDGDVDLSTSQTVRDAVCEALDGGARDVVLDLSGVSFLDSAGLNGLLNVARDVDRRGATLRCDAPQGGEPRVVIGLAGVAKLLNLSG